MQGEMGDLACSCLSVLDKFGLDIGREMDCIFVQMNLVSKWQSCRSKSEIEEPNGAIESETILEVPVELQEKLP